MLERAAVMSTSEVIDACDLSLPEDVATVPGDDDLDIHRNLRAAERQLVLKALDRATGNRAEAARLLGIARTQLYAKMRALDIKP